MNKYIRNMIAIAIIVAIFLVLFKYWNGVDSGVWHIFLILSGSYGIYLNFKAIYKRAGGFNERV